jgi:hypothetical protein
MRKVVSIAATTGFLVALSMGCIWFYIYNRGLSDTSGAQFFVKIGGYMWPTAIMMMDADKVAFGTVLLFLASSIANAFVYGVVALGIYAVWRKIFGPTGRCRSSRIRGSDCSGNVKDYSQYGFSSASAKFAKSNGDLDNSPVELPVAAWSGIDSRDPSTPRQCFLTGQNSRGAPVGMTDAKGLEIGQSFSLRLSAETGLKSSTYSVPLCWSFRMAASGNLRARSG